MDLSLKIGDFSTNCLLTDTIVLDNEKLFSFSLESLQFCTCDSCNIFIVILNIIQLLWFTIRAVHLMIMRIDEFHSEFKISETQIRFKTFTF